MQDFTYTINTWIQALDQYDQIQLCSKPTPQNWSIGQLYVHLIEDTKFYIDQIQSCLSTNDHTNAEALPFAKLLFLNNDFPDKAIEGAPSNAMILQPDNKDQLLQDLQKIKNEMHLLQEQILATAYTGKTKHPGLGYFSAAEWFQFAEIHFRHHLRQKKRIDLFLKTGSIH